MRLSILLAVLLAQGCAFYTVEATMPDGTTAKGRALVLNNSENVQLDVESADFKATFGKKGTNGDQQIEAIREVIGQ